MNMLRYNSNKTVREEMRSSATTPDRSVQAFQVQIHKEVFLRSTYAFRRKGGYNWWRNVCWLVRIREGQYNEWR